MNSKVAHIVPSIAVAHLTIEVCENYLPVLYPLLIATLGLNYTQIGAIALVASAAVTLPQPLSGYLSDRWQPHRLVALSVMWIGVVMGLVGFTDSYLSLLVVVGLGGLGSAVFHPPSAVIASAGGGQARRGAAMSIFSVSGNVGAALSPLAMAGLIGRLGMRGTAGLIPLGLLAGILVHVQLRRSAPTAADRAGLPARAMTNGVRVGLILIILAVMARSWFQVSLMTYLPTWMESQHGSVSAGGQMLFVLMMCVGLGSLAGGSLSDRIGRWQVLALSTALLAPAYWLFLGSAGAVQVALVGTIGFLIGASFPVTLVMAQETSPQRIGTVSGLVMGLGWLPGGLGASATGLIADQFSLTVGLQTLVVPIIASVTCSLLYAMLHKAQAGPRLEAAG